MSIIVKGVEEIRDKVVCKPNILLLNPVEQPYLENCVGRLYIGGYEEGSNQVVRQQLIKDLIKIWIPEELRSNPCLHYDVPRPPGTDIVYRFIIGGVYSKAIRMLVRVSIDKQACLHLSLPTGTEADKWIIWYRHQTFEEWAGDDFQHFSESEIRRNTPSFDETWERLDDPRTGDVWVRKI